MEISGNSHVDRPGMQIAPNDIIRNYLLDKLPDSLKLALYSKHWLYLEEITKTSKNLDTLIEDFLINFAQKHSNEILTKK